MNERIVDVSRVTRFQFTHPGKGATRMPIPLRLWPRWFQFTHPGKGATPTISPSNDATRCFNSRTLGRVRPMCNYDLTTNIEVSIHAPWEGCDRVRRTLGRGLLSFNSRTLGRVRQATTRTPARPLCFNSRTLGRVRPTLRIAKYRYLAVSIHAPWEGCD